MKFACAEFCDYLGSTDLIIKVYFAKAKQNEDITAKKSF